MLRCFELPDSNGWPTNLEKYQRQRSIVIFFGHGGCSQCAALMRDYASQAASIREEGAEPMAVLGSRDESAEPIAAQMALLVDSDGRAAQAQGLRAPALLIADRYGEIYVAWEGGEAHALPSGDEALAWVVSIERLCEECTISE